MGARPGPGSIGRRDGGLRKFDHLAQYGRGRIIDEATGEYESYEVPDGQEIPWEDILDQPQLIVADFAQLYGIRLPEVGNGLSWREFTVLTGGLLSTDSRLSRHFQASREE